MNTEQKEILKKVKAGGRLTVSEAVGLLAVKGADLYQVLETAERVKQRKHEDRITYVINYNLNLSNV